MEPLISVVIPVYNPGNYLIPCLESILSNTYTNLEILCIDDGSTDHSPEILQRYAKANQRIKIFRQPNGGVASARNTGISMASGDYITFIDSDDIIHPRYFEILLNGILKYHADAAFCDYDEVSDSQVQDTVINNPIYQTQDLDDILSDGRLRSTACARLYATEAVKNFRFSNLKLGEDCLFNCTVMCDLAYKKGRTVVKVNHPLYHYIQRKSSALHTSKTADKLPYCHQFLKLANNETDTYLKKAYTDLGFKYLLVARYEAAVERESKEIQESFQKELKRAIHLVNQNSGYSAKVKLVYHVFYLFPVTYRCFRILRDPSLREWEKETKKNRKRK